MQHGKNSAVHQILWVPHGGSGPLHIDATEQSSGDTFSLTLQEGPGPAQVTMPTPGCWRFELSWADKHDEMLVRYFPLAG